MAPPSSGEDPRGGDARRAAAAGDGLAAWAAELLVTEAARERARGHWLRQQAEEEGTFAGVLADLADRGRPVVLHLANGRMHRGIVVVLGDDVVVVVTAGGREVLVRRDAIASVRTVPGEPATVGDRPVRTTVTLAQAAARLAEERAPVLVLGHDPTQPVAGELRAVGADVLTVRLDGAGGTAYVALASVVEISLPESG